MAELGRKRNFMVMRVDSRFGYARKAHRLNQTSHKVEMFRRILGTRDKDIVAVYKKVRR